MNNQPQPASSNVIKVDPANPQQQHVIQISSTLEENRALDLLPVYVSLGLEPSAFHKELGGIPESEPSPFSLPKGVFDTAIRGSGQFTDQIWFFRGDSYFRYFESADGKDKVEGPFLIAPNWPGWPQSFASGIDAALPGTGSFEGKIFGSSRVVSIYASIWQATRSI